MDDLPGPATILRRPTHSDELPGFDVRGDRKRGGQITLEKISTIMGLFGLLFLVVVVAVSAWNERRTQFREAEGHAAETAFFLADHAQRLFEVADIALRSTILAIEPLDWTTIETSRPLWTSLKQTDALMPFVGNIWLNDQTGRLRLTTFAFPAPDTAASAQDLLNAVSASDHLFIGDRMTGRLTHQSTFLVARRITEPDGAVRGMAAATVDLSYFTRYWRGLDLLNRERIAVVHGGTGDVLVASGTALDTPAMPDVAGFRAAIAGDSVAGRFVPQQGFQTFYHRIGDLPVYLTVTFSRSEVVAAWRKWLLRLAPLAAAAALALVSIMGLGRRQGRRETEAARAIGAARLALQAANRTLEERVRARTADLQDSNEQIQRYAYIVSHDLRAPLVNIAGFTSELQQLRPALFPAGAPGGETAREFDEAIGFIQTSTDKMDRLINAILTLSREGRRNFRLEAVDLAALLRSIADGLAHQTGKANAVIEIGDLPTINTDRIAVEQVFSNLLDNAVKYLGNGRPGVVRVEGREHGGMTIVTVSDNGRGIDGADRERVFELFRRAGPQDKPGEGIGLAHVRALVRRLGGRILLDSQPGAGSTFTVELPTSNEATADATP